jgi:hypothetical protein
MNTDGFLQRGMAILSPAPRKLDPENTTNEPVGSPSGLWSIAFAIRVHLCASVAKSSFVVKAHPDI